MTEQIYTNYFCVAPCTHSNRMGMSGREAESLDESTLKYPKEWNKKKSAILQLRLRFALILPIVHDANVTDNMAPLNNPLVLIKGIQ